MADANAYYSLHREKKWTYQASGDQQNLKDWPGHIYLTRCFILRGNISSTMWQLIVGVIVRAKRMNL
jgi:hypothetical protein